jgi:hypothetical protein
LTLAESPNYDTPMPPRALFSMVMPRIQRPRKTRFVFPEKQLIGGIPLFDGLIMINPCTEVPETGVYGKINGLLNRILII